MPPRGYPEPAATTSILLQYAVDASSDADQAGQWSAEAAPEENPLTLVPVEIAPEPIVEPTVEVAADATAEGVI